MKTISFLIPTYNEEGNIQPLSEAIIKEMEKLGENYDYEMVFIDNDSKDNTRPILRQMCAANPKIKAILNARNFGQFNSPYYGMLQTTGDCTITLVADFQDPVELIPEFIKEWENGYKVVMGQKTKSDESKTMYFLRSFFYNFMDKHSSHGFIKQATGFGLYDKSFLDTLRQIDDPRPVLRGLVSEMGPEVKLIPYTQPKRRSGKSSNSFSKYYDAGCQVITNNTKFGVRLIIGTGLFLLISCIIALIALSVYKVFNWNDFNVLPYLLYTMLMLVLSALICFVGIVGEYVLNINDYVRKRPLVIESERINF